MVMMKIALCLILCTAVNQVSTENDSVCQGRTATLSCSSGKTIVIKDVMFGRQVPYSQKCFNKNRKEDTNCKGKEATEIVRKKCDGKEKCRVKASNGKLGPNPCPGTYKYAEFRYECKPVMPMVLPCKEQKVMPMVSLCKGQKGVLKCKKNCEIFIMDAMYGRQKGYGKKCHSRGAKRSTTCRSRNTMEIVEKKCNGHRSCELASNSSMGPDPCPGVDKYTEITYKCH